MNPIVKSIADIGRDVRYVAVAKDGAEPELWERQPNPDSSSPESDRYEELLVNPTLIALAGRRGDIDCGGLDYLLVRYGAFFQLVVPTDGGHLSVCISPEADIADVIRQIIQVLASHPGVTTDS